MSRSAYPIKMVPLTDAERDGSYVLLGDGEQFACARWNGEAFVFPGGQPIGFVASCVYAPEVAA